MTDERPVSYPQLFNMDAQSEITLRDLFAAAALTSYLSAPGEVGESARTSPAHVAEWAYQNADAMLRARAKGGSR